jgi:predicted neuraminidase
MTPTLAFALVLALQDPVLTREFLYEKAPFPSCHCSTIVDTKDGLVAAWFGGTDEGKDDVCIYVSRHDGKTWSEPAKVADGVTEKKRYPSWNPVLFQPKDGPLLLFFKIGPNPDLWWGLEMRSTDGGRTWSKPVALATDIMGPVRNPPIQLADGTLLSPTSTEVPKGTWTAQVEVSKDGGATWKKIGPLNDDKQVEVIQPALLTWPEGRLQMLCRNRNRGPMKNAIIECWSADGGATWSPMKATEHPNPNSGIAAVSLKDGRAVLVYNHTPKGRTPLNVAVSSDGKAWKDVVVLEDAPGEYSYPTVIQAADGKVHVVYTWRREKIRHVVLDPAKL